MIACPRQNGYAPVAFSRLRIVLPSQAEFALARVCEKQETAWFMEPAIMLKLVLYDRTRWDARFLELDTFLRG